MLYLSQEMGFETISFSDLLTSKNMIFKKTIVQLTTPCESYEEKFLHIPAQFLETLTANFIDITLNEDGSITVKNSNV